MRWPLLCLITTVSIGSGLLPTAMAESPQLRWRFEAAERPAAESPAPAASLQPTSTAELAKLDGAADATEALSVSPATAGAYVYDPLAGQSLPNVSSLRVKGSAPLTQPLPASFAGGSFTLELFLRADESMKNLQPREYAVAAAVRSGETGADVGPVAAELGIHRSKPPHSYPWWMGRFGGERSSTWLSANKYNGPTHVRDDAWRQMALVYDAGAGTLACYHDYALLERKPVTEFQPKQLVINQGFQGWIDEMRLTAAALEPHQFLRLTAEPLTDVSFRSPPGPLPEGTGYVDVRLRYGAVGDGKTDDTAAIQRAFRELDNRVPIAYHTLYFPPGTYLVSDTVQYSRFFIMQGAGPGKTIIRLKDNCPGYQDPEKPKPVVGNGWQSWGEWGRGAGNVIGNYMFDLTIDTGSDNPAAVGLDHHSNNHGAVENVTIRSGDAQGLIGLSLLRPWPGPALMKNITIDGFDYGVDAGHREYSLTFEFLTLRNQAKAGIRNRGNILAIRKLRSENTVPAIENRGGTGLIALLDSELVGGDPKTSAIVNEQAGLFARNVTTGGYRAALELDGEVREGSSIAEFSSDGVNSLFPTEKTSLNLPIEETPEIPWEAAEHWVNINDFADQRGEGGDWAPAIQAAIDSGARTIYFPQGGYGVSEPVRLRGNVQRLFGMRSEIYGMRDYPADQPVIIFDAELESGATPRPYVLERLGVQGLRHASPHTLVIKHGSPGAYTNAPGCGKLFIEDTVSNDYAFEHPQQVWVRQWNVESHEEGPCITSRGATIWALGFKTEYESSKFLATDGAQTEIFGAFIYPNNKMPPDRYIVKNVNSDLAIVYGTSVYTANHRVQIVDQQGEQTRELLSKDLPAYGPRQRQTLYVSRGRQE